MRLSLISLSESSHGAEGVSPYLVGGGILLALLFLLFVVVAFGGGRDHT
jgi:hypothetical protein